MVDEHNMTDGLVIGRRGRAAACGFVAAITLLVLLLQANNTARSGPLEPHENVLLSADSEEIQRIRRDMAGWRGVAGWRGRGSGASVVGRCSQVCL